MSSYETWSPNEVEETSKSTLDWRYLPLVIIPTITMIAIVGLFFVHVGNLFPTWTPEAISGFFLFMEKNAQYHWAFPIAITGLLIILSWMTQTHNWGTAALIVLGTIITVVFIRDMEWRSSINGVMYSKGLSPFTIDFQVKGGDSSSRVLGKIFPFGEK